MVIPITHRGGVGQAHPDHNRPTSLRSARRAALLAEIRRRGGRIDLTRDRHDYAARSVLDLLGLTWAQRDALVEELAGRGLVRVKPGCGTVVASAVADRPAGGGP